MHDLFFVGFLLALFGAGFRRPFVFVLGYAYIDIVSPQRLSYFLLNSIPISLIFFVAAVAGWLIAPGKAGRTVGFRQVLILLLLAWAAFTTLHADFPTEALQKWDWVWKSLVFAFFLPFTLQTRLRMEALLTFMILSASSIIVVGGVKTLASGGGYGSLNLGLSDNSGLYEGSIISTVAVAIVPVILFLARHGTIFPRDWKVRLFSAALVFACLLIPVGTEARTGLICVGALAVLMLRSVKRRLLYLVLMVAAGVAAVPLLPSSFSQRMETIQGYQGDQSASTRIAVWAWTWNYVGDHPLGGGFEAYRQNKLSYQTVARTRVGNTETVTLAQATDASRAYHSSYFEMLGEQGWPGFILWVVLHVGGLIQMELVRRRSKGQDEWSAALATSLQSAHVIYLVGSLFVGIAFESFAYMLIGVEIALAAHCRAARLAGSARTWGDPGETGPADAPAVLRETAAPNGALSKAGVLRSPIVSAARRATAG